MKRFARSHGRRHGYTLIEVLTAAVIIGVALSAAVSMTATMALQEELSWRVTESLNYQENAARLWQLGLTPFEVTSLMPGTSGNPLLSSILTGTGTTSSLGTSDIDGIGNLEAASNSIQVKNFASASDAGDVTSVTVYRPTTR